MTLLSLQPSQVVGDFPSISLGGVGGGGAVCSLLLTAASKLCLFQTILSASFLSTQCEYHDIRLDHPLLFLLQSSMNPLYVYSPSVLEDFNSGIPATPFWHTFIKIAMFPIFSNTLISQCHGLHSSWNLISILSQPFIPIAIPVITNTQDLYINSVVYPTLQPPLPICPTYSPSYSNSNNLSILLVTIVCPS